MYNSTAHYTFTDDAHFSGYIYYRLRIKEHGTADVFSQIVMVHIREYAVFSVYPQPASNSITLSLKDEAKENCMLELYDLSGKYISGYRLTSGTQTITLSDLVSGTYIAKIINGGEISFGKIIRE